MPGSITYRHSTGARLTGANAKIISSISAAGVVTSTTPWGANLPAVGEIVELFGSGVPNYNKGFYAVIAASGSTLTLTPKPRAQGTSTVTGIAKTTQFAQYTIAGTSNITEIIALDPPLAYLRVAGADFKTAGTSGDLKTGVRRNDRVQISGSSTAANNGSWIIHEVLNNTTLILRPYDNGEFLQSQSASGSIIVRQGKIRVAINNVGANSWSNTASIGVPRAGPYGSKFYRFGSGSISDYLRIHTIGDSGTVELRSFVELAGVQALDFYLSAVRGATFYSLNEIAVVTHTTGAVGDCIFTAVNQASWPGELTVELGDNTGDRYSAGNGSAWVGIVPSISVAMTGQRINAYGSYIDGTGTNELSLGRGDVTACIVRPRVNTDTGRIESIIAYGDSGNASGSLTASGAGDQDNILITKQGTTNSSINSACIIGGLLVSNKLFSPVAFNNNVTGGGVVEIRDPRIDIDLNDYFSNTSADGQVIKTYQFNPRFVSSDSNALTPVPVFYLTIDVIEINETDLTPIALIHDTTNQEGLLVDGARYLTRQSIDGTAETSTLFSHRVIVEGAGFRLHDEIIQLTEPRVGDWAVQRVRPDYEGEFGE